MSNRNKFRVLLGNDDGFRAPGIRALAKAMSEIADVTIVAPSGPRSGFSSAITTTQALKLKSRVSDIDGVKIYSIDGTPVDCIKLALHTIFKDDKPDIIVSGCNHGSNEGICVLYSGTIGAAIEGAIVGIPSLAVSIDDVAENPDFTNAVKYALIVINKMLKEEVLPFTVLSLNVPKGEVKGLKVCRQSIGRFVDEYIISKDGRNKDVYWCTGKQINQQSQILGDYQLLRDGYATITPLKIDLTNDDFIEPLKSWFD